MDNQRYTELHSLFADLKETATKIIERMGPERMYYNTVLAELEMCVEKRTRVLEEIRSLEGDIEIKKQMAQKIIDMANEKATELLDAAKANNVKSIRLLDEVHKFVKDADLKSRMNELVKASK